MSYQLKLSNGTVVAQIGDRTIDQSTSLSLIGRGAVLFGSSVLENFIYLLENFSNVSPPDRPLVGQLWFDSSASLLKVYSTQNAWVSVSDNGVFGNTGQLNQGLLISGALSSRVRLAGTVGVVLVGGSGSTTVAVTFAEGVIIHASSEYAIAFADLPPTITVSGHSLPFSGLFPHGLVPGVNLSQQQVKLRYAGDTGYSDALAAVPYLLSGDDDGLVNALHVTVPADLVGYQRYLAVLTSPAHTNTGPSTLSINSLPPAPILRLSGAPMAAGDLVAGAYCRFLFDGQAFRLDQMLSYQSDAIDQVSGIAVQVAGNNAAIVTEQQVRASSNSAFAQQITTLVANVADNHAMLQTVQTASATATSALAKQVTDLTATVNNGQGDLTAKYNQVITAQADQGSALVEQITDLKATYMGSTADLYTKLSAQVSASSSTTSVVNSLVATTAGNSANLTQYYETTTSATEALSQNYLSLKSTVDGNTSTLTNVQTTFSNFQTTYSQQYTKLQSDFANNTAQFTNDIQTQADAVHALTTQVTEYKSQTDQNVSDLKTTVTQSTTATNAYFDQLTTLKNTVDGNTSTFTNQLTAQTNSTNALTQVVQNLSATVGSNYADVTSKIIAQADANSATAGKLDSYKTQIDGSLASINQSITSMNGNQVQYQLVGNINGTTGGFTFTGVKTPDGAVYNMVFNSNVQITGNLLVGGSVDYGALVPGQVQRITANATLYVNCNSGTDSFGAGSAATPFRTLSYCLSYIQQNLAVAGGIAVFLQAGGTYDIPETMPYFSNSLTIIGDQNNPGGYNITRSSATGALFISTSQSLNFQGLTLTNPGGGNITTAVASNGGSISFSYVTFQIASGRTIGTGAIMQINPNSSISLGLGCTFVGGSNYSSWVFCNGGTFSAGTNGAPAPTTVVTFVNGVYAYMFVVGSLSSAYLLSGLQFTGSVSSSHQWSVGQLGILSTGGRTGNFIPGTASNSSNGLVT